MVRKFRQTSPNNNYSKSYIAINLKHILLSIIVIFNIFQKISPQRDTNTTETMEIPEHHIYKQITAIKIRNLKILYKLLNETDNSVFAYFYTKISKNSIIGAEMVKMISEKLDFMVSFVLIDCDDVEPYDYKYCAKDPEAKDGYPRMVVYTPPEYRRNPYTGEKQYASEHIYSQKEVSEPLLYNFVTSFIKGKSKRLTSENIEGFLDDNNFNKVLLFTERKKTSLLYKGLSSFFYDRLLFGEVKKENKALIKRFGIKTFPSVILYLTQQDEMYLDEPRIERFNGTISSRGIASFVGKYALPHKMWLKIEKNENINEIKYKVSLRDLTKNDYMQYLTTFISKRFIIYLSDEIETEVPSEFPVENPEDLKRMSKNTNGFFLFVKFKCGGENASFCQTTFNVNNFPALLLVHKTVSSEDGTQIDDISERLKRSVKLSMDYDTMEKEILKEFPLNMKKIDSQNIVQTLSEAENQKITPLVYLYESEIPIGLQLLSREDSLKKYVQISEFQNPSKDLMKNFQVKFLPSTIFLMKDQNNPKSNQ
jgi:hypothetical protein